MQYAVLRAVNCTTQLDFMSVCTDRHPVTRPSISVRLIAKIVM